MPGVVRIATRTSALALWQARHVAERLEACHPGLQAKLVPLSTRGDELLETPLAKIGGKGLFLRELERALLEHEADIAVHSMKDVPVEMTSGLAIGAVLERASPFDAWLSRSGAGIDELPGESTVGTSSLRRQSQLLARRPDLRVESLRGNVNTRVEKLDAGAYDAIILATAGLERLGLGRRITAELCAPEWLPAPAQGVIGVQCRSGDDQIAELIAGLDVPTTAQTTLAERALSSRLGGSCQLPLAAYAELRPGESLELHAMVGSSDGRTVLRSVGRGPAQNPGKVAAQAAADLLEQGADAIIRAEIELADR